MQRKQDRCSRKYIKAGSSKEFECYALCHVLQETNLFLLMLHLFVLHAIKFPLFFFFFLMCSAQEVGLRKKECLICYTFCCSNYRENVLIFSCLWFLAFLIFLKYIRTTVNFSVPYCQQSDNEVVNFCMSRMFPGYNLNRDPSQCSRVALASYFSSFLTPPSFFTSVKGDHHRDVTQELKEAHSCSWHTHSKQSIVSLMITVIDSSGFC